MRLEIGEPSAIDTAGLRASTRRHWPRGWPRVVKPVPPHLGLGVQLGLGAQQPRMVEPVPPQCLKDLTHESPLGISLYY